MNRKLEKSVKQWLSIFLAIIAYYIVHEGMHLLIALLLGVFEKVRIIGLIGIQIVTTENSLSGVNLAIFSGLSSIVTVLIGYILVFSKSIYKIKNKNVLTAIYYVTLCFLMLDPLYISTLAPYVGGGDLNGITTGLAISGTPIRIIAGIILIINFMIFKKTMHPKITGMFKEK